MWELGTLREDDQSRPVIPSQEDTVPCKDSHSAAFFPPFPAESLTACLLETKQTSNKWQATKVKSQLRQQSRMKIYNKRKTAIKFGSVLTFIIPVPCFSSALQSGILSVDHIASSTLSH
jgi:hypothetical protein